MRPADAHIAMMDTGVGGVYVLSRARALMPREDFVYLADLAHAPYGDRPLEEIRSLTLDIAADLVNHGAKALFIACNTATSAAVDLLREKFTIPVVGMEPAIKPALEKVPQGRIAVLATPATLRLEKFRDLMEREDQSHRVLPLPCPGLSRLIETDGLDSPAVLQYLRDLSSSAGDVSAVVVGCTHYSFLHRQLSRAFGDVPVFDGADGACRRMRDLLGRQDLLRDGPDGAVHMASNTFLASDQELLEHFYDLAEAER